MLFCLIQILANANFELARVSWRPEVVTSILNKLLEADIHEKYVISKKSNKMDKFFDFVGEKFSLSGNKIRDLLKNIGKEFRAINQKLLLSGSETEEKIIKGSSEIYELFVLYQDMYYPKGSAVQPKSIITESQ